MLNQIKGLHHVTSMARDARDNNAFFTGTLGLRRVKKTVNFDAPDVYHLYYADEAGTPGSVMTFFPFPDIGMGRRGAGEVGTTVYAAPRNSLRFWEKRLDEAGVKGLERQSSFGDNRLAFEGPDGDHFALVETDDTRPGWTGNGVPDEAAIRGFHSASLRVRDGGPTRELLGYMGYETIDRSDNTERMTVLAGNEARIIDIETIPDAPLARLGAGSVHHIAFSVENKAAQIEVRKALVDTGYQVTPVIDRNYFWSIYFRTPGGVLFEIATNEPGFDVDEDTAHLGEALKLPHQHEHLREQLEKHLQPIAN